jgi:hypothetical protein
MIEATRPSTDDVMVEARANVEEVEDIIKADVYSDTVVFAAGHQYAYVRRNWRLVVPSLRSSMVRVPCFHQRSLRALLLLIHPSCSLFLLLHLPRSPSLFPFPPSRHRHPLASQNELPVSPMDLHILMLDVQDCFCRALAKTCWHCLLLLLLLPLFPPTIGPLPYPASQQCKPSP